MYSTRQGCEAALQAIQESFDIMDRGGEWLYAEIWLNNAKGTLQEALEATDQKGECVRSLAAMFPDVPDDFRHNGQSFAERCEAWIMHAVDELEREVEEFGGKDGDEDDAELKWRNFYKCPRCGHKWNDTWDSQCDDDCPECGCRHINPYESEEVGE